MKTFIAAAFAVALSGLAASASTIQLNVGKYWTQGTNTYSNGSETVKVSGWQYDGLANKLTSSRSATASWGGYHGGVGICSAYYKGHCFDEQHTTDGKWGNDLALFDFGGKVVKLTSITFAYADAMDKFDLLVFGDGKGSAATNYQWDIKTGGGYSGYSVATVDLTGYGLDTGSLFGIGAYHKKSEFKIQAIHYSVVPLPAAGWLLLAGVGGLAAFKRRRKNA